MRKGRAPTRASAARDSPKPKQKEGEDEQTLGERSDKLAGRLERWDEADERGRGQESRG